MINSKSQALQELIERFNATFPYLIPESIDEPFHPLLIANMNLRRVLKAFLSTECTQLLEKERERIKADLLAIADQGEYEDLRREVEIYFEPKQ